MNGKDALIYTDSNYKLLKSEDYNFIFNLKTGAFQRWGKEFKDDPVYSKIGPELLDVEVSTICSGIPPLNSEKQVPCKHCYKNNGPSGSNMSFETFKKIFEKLPKTVCQIAFGIGDLTSNPDFFKIMEFCKENNVIPNYTTNGYLLTDDLAEKTVKICGAVACSSYASNKELCYNSVSKFIKANKKLNEKLQVNIHCLLSKETLNFCYEVALDSKKDERLSELNAIVFLLLKECGRGKSYLSISIEEYRKFLSFLFENKIKFGHDSCCYPNLISNVKEDMKENIRTIAEGCESTRFSLYSNVAGKAFPCSFAESKFNGTSLIDKDFRDVWMSNEIVSFRKSLIESTSKCKCIEKEKTCMKCPIYNVSLCCS